jgi:hypothetical protein
MSKILKTTLATAFAAACLAGASFAADNGGMKSKPGSKNNDSMMQTDPSKTGSIKCDNSNANVNSGCDKPGMMKQEQKQKKQY